MKDVPPVFYRFRPAFQINGKGDDVSSMGSLTSDESRRGGPQRDDRIGGGRGGPGSPKGGSTAVMLVFSSRGLFVAFCSLLLLQEHQRGACLADCEQHRMLFSVA